MRRRRLAVNYTKMVLAYVAQKNLQPAALPLFFPYHKTEPFIFTLAFPAFMHLWVVLEGKVGGRLSVRR